MSDDPAARAAPLGVVLVVTFLGSITGGTFWAGIFFVTAAHHHFSPTRNLALGAAMGLVYAGCARGTGTILRRLERHLAPRSVLLATLGTWAIFALLPVAAPHTELALWLAALGGAAAASMTWPVLESYVGAGRHGPRLRAAIGGFNVTWTPATAVSLFILPLCARIGVLWAIGVCAIFNVLALLVGTRLPPRPAVHEIETTTVGPEYTALLRAASWLLPLSYLISAALAPVLPHRLAAFGGHLPDSVVAATWMVARFLTLAIMWRVGFWHGRWGTLALGTSALLGGFAVVLLASGLPAVVAGLALLGAGMGLTYYAALYYALSVGRGAVDAGGNFEALIGLGYCVGPLLGLGGRALSSTSGTGTVVLVWIAAALFVAPALRAYARARRSRQRGAHAGP